MTSNTQIKPFRNTNQRSTKILRLFPMVKRPVFLRKSWLQLPIPTKALIKLVQPVITQKCPRLNSKHLFTISLRVKFKESCLNTMSKSITIRHGIRIPVQVSMIFRSLGRSSSILLVKTQSSNQKYPTAKITKKKQKHQVQELTKQ